MQSFGRTRQGSGTKMIGYEDCPYCEENTEICYEGVSEGENFEVECNNCDKTFNCTHAESVDFYPEKIEKLSKENITIEGCGEYFNARLGIRCGNKNYGVFCDDCQEKQDKENAQ